MPACIVFTALRLRVRAWNNSPPRFRETPQVLTGVVQVLSCRVVDEGRVTVLFQRGTALRQADIAIGDFKITAEREIGQLPATI